MNRFGMRLFIKDEIFGISEYLGKKSLLSGLDDISVKNIERNIMSFYQRLVDNGVPFNYVRRLIFEIIDSVDTMDISEYENLYNKAFEILSRKICNNGRIELNGETKVVALVGLQNCGKTTTVAKLATSHCFKGRSVAIMSVDKHDNLSVKRLEMASIAMGAEFASINNKFQWYRLIRNIRKFDLVLIDTPPLERNVFNLLDRFELCSEGIPIHEVHIVIDSSGKNRHLGDLSSCFNQRKHISIILTKLDKIQRYGGMLQHIERVAQYLRKPGLSYVSLGKDIPDDLVEADANDIIKKILGEI